jgi:hypothetical protein
MAVGADTGLATTSSEGKTALEAAGFSWPGCLNFRSQPHLATVGDLGNNPLPSLQ